MLDDDENRPQAPIQRKNPPLEKNVRIELKESQ